MNQRRFSAYYLISLVCTIMVAVVCYWMAIPNPNVILITAIVFFTFIGGYASGTASAVVVLGYSLLFFSLPGRLLRYSPENLKKIFVIVIFVPVLVLLVGSLKKRADDQNAQLAQSNAMLQRLAGIDYLTDIPNRRTFDKELQALYAQCAQEGQSICCALVDIDYFKQYNDYYGHIAGDECLKKLAQTIKTEMMPNGYFVARFGGEEFALVFARTTLSEAAAECQKIIAALEEMQMPHLYSPVARYVTVSIGIAVVAGERHDGLKLVEAADKALYLAKTNGRNRIAQLTVV